MTHGRMKGFLSFLILWLISKRSMTGVEVALELEKRKGRRLSPGTVYPVLKHLKDQGLLSIDATKSYSLTDQGKRELRVHLNAFLSQLDRCLQRTSDHNRRGDDRQVPTLSLHVGTA